MDKGTFYSLALNAIGEREYVADTPSANACDRHAQQVIAFACDFHPWTFAARKLTLDSSQGYVELPSDCLRFVRCDFARFWMSGSQVINRGKQQDVVTITYTSSVYADTVSLPIQQSSFNQACVLLLAAAVAPVVASDLRLAQSLKQEGLSLLHDARHKDAVMHDSNDQQPILDY